MYENNLVAVKGIVILLIRRELIPVNFDSADTYRPEWEVIYHNFIYDNDSQIMKPSGNDVLSGRGAGFNQHPGNEHFRRIIEQQKVRRKSPNVSLVHLISFKDEYSSSTTIQITNC